LPRLERQRTLASALRAVEQQTPQVGVVAVRAAAGSAQFVLPGTLRARIESPIFARTEGYLHKRLVDIGERVKTGQVLAELETPKSRSSRHASARHRMQCAQSKPIIDGSTRSNHSHASPRRSTASSPRETSTAILER